jgi:phosphoribosylanthranilate isomerase
MWVKICANTNLEDALLAAELGADALGFVFAESKRRVTAAQVALITPHLPDGIEKVGVFHTQNAEEIAEIVQMARLTTVQLHGGFDPALPVRLKEFISYVKIIQTLHWVADGSEDSRQAIGSQLEEIRRNGTTDRVLIDSRVGKATGGTGVSFDWNTAGEVFSEHGRELKIIAAGGLKPYNLAEAMSLMHPWGVDVASGVEATPGRKDAKALSAFLRIAKSYSGTQIAEEIR